MADFTLTPRSALGGHARDWPGLTLREVEGLVLVAIAARHGRAEALRERAETLGLTLPGPGRFTAGGEITAYWIGPDQWLVAGESAGLMARLADVLGDAVALTDQSDAWAALRLSGPEAPRALVRLCPLDLAPAAFPTGSAARTVMQHLAVLIAREDDAPTFLLLSARSSARSFLHAVEAAAKSALA